VLAASCFVSTLLFEPSLLGQALFFLALLIEEGGFWSIAFGNFGIVQATWHFFQHSFCSKEFSLSDSRWAAVEPERKSTLLSHVQELLVQRVQNLRHIGWVYRYRYCFYTMYQNRWVLEFWPNFWLVWHKRDEHHPIHSQYLVWNGVNILQSQLVLENVWVKIVQTRVSQKYSDVPIGP
jgi:hypothetical protein